MKTIDDAFLADFRAQSFGYPLDDDSNAGFVPAAGTPYIRVRNFLNAEGARSISSHNEVTGAFQFTIFWPEGTGSYDPVALADTIFDAFPVGRSITRDGQSALVTGRHRMSTYPEDGWFKVSGNITYRAFLAR